MSWAPSRPAGIECFRCNCPMRANVYAVSVDDEGCCKERKQTASEPPRPRVVSRTSPQAAVTLPPYPWSNHEQIRPSFIPHPGLTLLLSPTASTSQLRISEPFFFLPFPSVHSIPPNTSPSPLLPQFFSPLGRRFMSQSCFSFFIRRLRL